MQPPPAPAPWQALAELKDGLLPTGELPPLVLRQSDSARVTPEPVPASKLPVPPSTAMAPSPTPATDVAVSNSLASTLRGFLSLCAPRLATLALLACLVPAIVFASPAGTRPSRYDLVAQTLQARLGRVPSPTLVRGVMNALPIPTGDLDTSFDTDGKQTVSFGGTDQAQAIGVDGSGRIVVAGYTSAGATGYDIAVARLTSSGALDATFAGDGTLTIHVTGDDYAYALAFDGDGNIIVVGSTQDNV
ncbi:MAG TPA: delta-60 repeat domain-containing protein, partial [Rhodothermales bacterium]|nr:delta-60 repeat domain-containing protein [Rhodothermales bacterium]